MKVYPTRKKFIGMVRRRALSRYRSQARLIRFIREQQGVELNIQQVSKVLSGTRPLPEVLRAILRQLGLEVRYNLIEDTYEVEESDGIHPRP